jgi:hypothetical protein
MTTQQTVQRMPDRPAIRVPLSAGQHILHLLLTLLTGVWGIVWIWRAVSGNKVWADTQPGWQWGPWPYTAWYQHYGQRPPWEPQ